MATPRKRWFKVPDEVGAAAASNEALAFYLRLGSHLSTRWAADGLASDEAARCTLSPGQLAHLAGCKRTERAERVAREFASCFGATFEKDAACYRIEWAKFASLQWPTSDDGGTSGNEAPRNAPPPRHASRDTRHATLVAGSRGFFSEGGRKLAKPTASNVSDERMAELLDRVPGLEDTPTVREKVAALSWADVEHAIDRAHADAMDGKARHLPGYFVSLLNERIVSGRSRGAHG